MRKRRIYLSMLITASVLLSSCSSSPKKPTITNISEEMATALETNEIKSESSLLTSDFSDSSETSYENQIDEIKESEQTDFSVSGKMILFEMGELTVSLSESLEQTKTNETFQDETGLYEYLNGLEMNVNEWQASINEDVFYVITQMQLIKGQEKNPSDGEFGQLIDLNYTVSDIEAQVEWLGGDEYIVQNADKSIILPEAMGQITEEGKKVIQLGYYSPDSYELWNILVVANEAIADDTFENIRRSIKIK